MPVKRVPKPITDADIPIVIARDSETAAAVAAHISALHPPQVFGFGQDVGTEDVFDFGSGFLDCRNGGGTFPPNMGHIQGFQARFAYTAGKWGMQLVTQNSTDNECYFRTVNWDVWGAWRRIWNDGNFNPANYLLKSEGDERYRQSNVTLTDPDIPEAVARDSEVSSAVAAHVTSFHSVRCSLISTVVSPVGTETFVGIGSIPAGKIVGINAYILDDLGVSGINYIFRGGGGDFSPNPRLVSGTIRIGGVSASQLVGKPLHFLIWHLQ